MVKLGKLGVACALCLTMSLSLFTSGAFAQSTRQNTTNKAALTMTANSAFQNNANMQANGWGGNCGFGCGGGFGDGFGGGCFSCGNGLSHSGFVRFTRIVHITRITKFVRFEHFHHSNWGGGCGSCGWGGGGWVGGGGADW